MKAEQSPGLLRDALAAASVSQLRCEGVTSESGARCPLPAPAPAIAKPPVPPVSAPLSETKTCLSIYKTKLNRTSLHCSGQHVLGRLQNTWWLVAMSKVKLFGWMHMDQCHHHFKTQTTVYCVK